MKIKKNDLFIGMYLLAAVVFFIISIPSWLLDFLLALNIAVSLIILFNALYAKEVLDMASFPTMILFTTIFRISLNVSSTKLILSKGDAGKVVDTFGQFVGGGNLVIGVIIFIVLIIIQFIVINKGSERVAEVTARFTLDAMAGKQMAIDSDLNTGAITDKEAAERRKKLQQENSFFGSMDGATKYVKGDATAGLIITGINIVGGIIMGMMYDGLSINEALTKYTILTIGDGLCSQIPSLLISLATGVLVTKASSDGELGDEIVGQLFSIDKVLMMVGAALALLGIVTPLPVYIFVPFGILLIVAGRKLSGKKGEAEIEEEVEREETEAQEIRKPENVVSLLNVDPIELEFGYGIIPLADVNQGGDLLDRVVMIRRQIALELGAVVPIIRLRDNIQLNPNQYVIKIKGIQVSEGEILFDHYMAMNPGYVEEEITGIPTFEPSFHLPAIWITESQRERAESLGYTVVDPPSIIATHLTEVIRQHISELLTRQDVQNLINNVKENNPTLIEELVPKLLGVGEIQKVLQNLLEEGISIRDLVTIFETLADHAPVTRDTDILTEYVRQSLKRAISGKYFPPNEVTNVVTLDPAVEQEIMGSVKNTEQGSYLTLDPEKIKKIVASLKESLKKLEDMGKNPIVITSPIVRLYFKKLVSDYFKDIIVISYNEVEPNVELQSVGMVTE
jgi:flagellar biosynthesis protein FlhA